MEEPVSEGGGTSGNGRRRDKSQRTEDGVGGRKEEGDRKEKINQKKKKNIGVRYCFFLILST